METCNLLAIIGLCLDMIGVIIIFFFGISPRLDIEGQTYIITGGKDEKEIKKAKCYKRLAWLVGYIFCFCWIFHAVSELFNLN